MQQYSFLATQIAFSHPLAGAFLQTAGTGTGSVMIKNAQDHTATDIAADGGAMLSFVAGDNGGADFVMQQTSDMNDYLIGWDNAVVTAAKNGDLSNFANMSIVVRNTVTGRTHTLTGVSPSKIPDTPYQKQGQSVTWSLPAANVVNL
jgi:hypothetical protein